METPSDPTTWRARILAQCRAVLGGSSETSVTNRLAGTIFIIRVLSAALGGGTSSRLFQEVREHRGLAYGVYSFAAHYADAGMVGVAFGCLPSKVDEVLTVVRAELDKLAAQGIGTEELERGKGQLRGGMVLSLEDSVSRMSRIAKAELLYDELPSIDEVLQRVDDVTLDDVNTLARNLFSQPQTLAVVGPFDERSALTA